MLDLQSQAVLPLQRLANNYTYRDNINNFKYPYINIVTDHTSEPPNLYWNLTPESRNSPYVSVTVTAARYTPACVNVTYTYPHAWHGRCSTRHGTIVRHVVVSITLTRQVCICYRRCAFVRYKADEFCEARGLRLHCRSWGIRSVVDWSERVVRVDIEVKVLVRV